MVDDGVPKENPQFQSLDSYIPFGANFLFDELKNKSNEFVQKAKGNRIALRTYYSGNKIIMDMGGVSIPNIHAEQSFSNGEYVPIVSADVGTLNEDLPETKKLDYMVWFACREEEGFKNYRKGDISSIIDLLVGNEKITYVLQAAINPRTFNVPGEYDNASTVPRYTTSTIPQIASSKGRMRVEVQKKE